MRKKQLNTCISKPVLQPTGGGAQGARPPKLSQFFAIHVHVYSSIKRTTSTLSRPASRPQQRACAHVYADAVLPVQYIGSPQPVVD